MSAVPGPNAPCWCGSGQKYKRCHRNRDEPVKPGTLSPERAVPDEIVRPPYIATDGDPGDRDDPLVKTPEIIAAMRPVGIAAGEVLDAVAAAVAPGVTTDTLDAIAHDAYIARGGYPSPLGYRGFPKSVCTSVNEVICHGFPDSSELQDGDIVNVDVTIYLDGVHGDTNATFAVGEIDPRSAELMHVTRECLMRGIEAVKPGAEVRVIGRAIQEHAEADGFGVVRTFCGHAIGTEFHGAMSVPALRRTSRHDRDGARDDLHDRADDHHGVVAGADLARRLDRGHHRRPAHRPVRAHAARHRRRGGDPHPIGLGGRTQLERVSPEAPGALASRPEGCRSGRTGWS